jgi:ABC-type uncharacterized transport system involved in gliding motility auxiliary subunit
MAQEPTGGAAPRRAGLTPSTRGALQLAVQVSLSVALFAALQLLAVRHNRRFDLTPERAHVLSEQAVQVTRGLQEPVRITAFYSGQESERRREMVDLLEQFAAASPHVRFRLVDLDRSPALAEKYHVSSYNTGALEGGDRTLGLRAIDEEEIASALLKLTRSGPRTVCFLTGHGEHRPESNDERTGYSEIAKALERENFAIRTLDTAPGSGVPSDCAITVVAGPTHDLVPGEADALAAYLEGGGRLLLLVDPQAPASVVGFLQRFGIAAGNDVIVDERNRFLGADSFMPRVPIFDEGTFGKALDSAAVLAVARTVRPLDDTRAGRRVALIALTSEQSWARVDDGARPDADVSFRRGTDHPGPLPVAVLATLGDPRAGDPDAAQVGRLAVVGDSDFASNFYVNLLGNKDFFLSTVAVLAEEPQLIAVRRKGMPRGTLSPITLTAAEGNRIFWICVVAQPAAFALLGLAVTLSRRRQRGGR